MKRRYDILYGLLIVLLLSGCNLKTQTLMDFYGDKFSNVSKIDISDGNTGEIRSTEDKVLINTFLDELKNINFIPEEKQEARDGFNYSISLYEEGKEPFGFTPTYVDGDYYYTDPDIHPSIEDFYKKLNRNSKEN